MHITPPPSTLDSHQRSLGYRLRMRNALAPYPRPIRIAGFTLIEMSVILVVIGLLVGGVLVGQSMYETAQMRNQIAQIEEFTTAAHIFEAKYACLPGDCWDAVSFGLGSSGNPGANGDGDGAVTSKHSAFDNHFQGQSYESLNFWYHLSQAELIGGEFDGYYSGIVWGDGPGKAAQMATTPKAIIGDNAHLMVTNFGVAGGNYRTAGGSFYFYQPGTAHETRRTGIPPVLAHKLDTKIDDGKPLTGIVGCLDITIPTNQPMRVISSGACGHPGGAACNSGNSYLLTSNNVCSTTVMDKF